MLTRRELLATSAALAVAGRTRADADDANFTPNILAKGEAAPDPRLGDPLTLNGYFPFTPPKTLAQWTERKAQVQQQLRVSLGLWPMPEKSVLAPKIYGTIARDGYTIEMVTFESRPGHTVSGNLYRPTGRPTGERSAAVLSPYGHYPDGRFRTNTPKEIEANLKAKGDARADSARYPTQARCASLAKLGFVVFMFDMVGYADSQALDHRDAGFMTASALLHNQSMMGLQSWNVIRSYDFLESLPDVDPKRIGVTGESGGGTQTFIFCALDDRPAAAFPAVMVGSAMQGGCTCENAPNLRVGTGNVEFAALFAPKPMAMSCVNDWTKDFLKPGYGLPELKQLYTLYGKPENIDAKLWLEFPHSYNQKAREFMYGWFFKHLRGEERTVSEPPFVPVPPKELSVFDASHPRPTTDKPAAILAEEWGKPIALPTTPKDRMAFVSLVKPALEVILATRLPKEVKVRRAPIIIERDGLTIKKTLLGRTDDSIAIPTIGVMSNTAKYTGQMILWVHPEGKSSLFAQGKLAPLAQSLVGAGYAIIAPDLLGSGEQVYRTPPSVDKTYAGYTFGYNRTRFGQQTHDLLTVLATMKTLIETKSIQLLGWGNTGTATLLATALAGGMVTRTIADADRFDFRVSEPTDLRLLPGILKFGGLGGVLACCTAATIVHQAPESLAIGSDRTREKLSDAEILKRLQSV